MAESKKGLDVFKKYDEVTYSRFGKKVSVIGMDGTFADSDAVEANLLYDILKQLKSGK